MKRTVLGVLVLVALASSPAVAQRIYIDYDESVDFTRYKTFAWAPTTEVSLADTSPLMDARIRNGIKYWFTTGGAIEDEENPDLYVTYFSEESEEVRLNTSSFGYGYGDGWRWDPYWGGGMSPSTTTVQTYAKGTLVIDVWDAATKTAIWRGTISGCIPDKPEKQAKKIDQGVEKLAKKWRKMYHGE